MIAVQFQSTITLGAIIITAAGGIGALAVFGYGVRWKSAWKVASTHAEELRKALADEVGRGARAEERLREALELIGDQKRTIERLEALPNLAHLVTLMSDTAERQDAHATERLTHGLREIRIYVDDRFDAHDRRAQERHKAQITALAEMTRLLRDLREFGIQR